MWKKLIHSTLAASVSVATAAGTSAAVLAWAPEGKVQETLERFVAAPGGMLYERLQGRKEVRGIAKSVDAAAEKVKDGVDDAKEKLEDMGMGKAVDKASDSARRLPHYYNVGVWAVAGFSLCFLMTLFFGVSSFKSALALGFKVTLTLVFLQGALVFGGILAYQRWAGG